MKNKLKIVLQNDKMRLHNRNGPSLFHHILSEVQAVFSIDLTYGVPKAKKLKFLVCEPTIISYLI